ASVAIFAVWTAASESPQAIAVFPAKSSPEISKPRSARTRRASAFRTIRMRTPFAASLPRRDSDSFTVRPPKERKSIPCAFPISFVSSATTRRLTRLGMDDLPGDADARPHRRGDRDLAEELALRGGGPERGDVVEEGLKIRAEILDGERTLAEERVDVP